jgi:hypothetical protein
MVLRGVRRAADRGDLDLARTRVELLLLHPVAQHDARDIESLDLAHVVRVVATVPRQVAVARERTAQVLLHLRWDDPRETGILTGKLFEYLAAGRPILSTGRYRDDVSELLERTGAGRATTTEEETAAYLAEAFRQFVSAGEVVYRANPDELARLGSEHSAESISGLLDRVSTP